MGLALSRLPWSKPGEWEDLGNYTATGNPVGVYMLRLRLANVYYADGILIDSGTILDFETIRTAIDSLAVPASPIGGNGVKIKPPLIGHAITHAHPDHQGSSASICEHYKVPYLCGEKDKGVAEGSQRMAVGPKFHPLHWLPHQLWSGRGHPVSQALKAGDRIGESGALHIIETPGHTLGSISFWIPQSRVAIVGDLLANHSWVTIGRYQLPPCPRQPPRRLNAVGGGMNRESLARIMALGPRIICFGHGPPLVLEEVATVGVTAPAGAAV